MSQTIKGNFTELVAYRFTHHPDACPFDLIEQAAAKRGTVVTEEQARRLWDVAHGFRAGNITADEVEKWCESAM